MASTDIQKLREITGAGVMDCQKALKDSNNNFDAALALIRERGLLKMEKRAGRSTGAGLIHSYVHNGRIGVLLDLRAETDFVVRSEPFKALAHDLVMQLAAVPAENPEALLAQPYIKDESRTVKDIIGDVIAKVGENITVGGFYRMEL